MVCGVRSREKAGAKDRRSFWKRSEGRGSSAARDMSRDYRDRRGGHPRDPRGLADGPGLSPRALFDGLAGKARDSFVVEIARNGSGLEGLQSLQSFLFPADVALVPNPCLEDGLL